MHLCLQLIGNLTGTSCSTNIIIILIEKYLHLKERELLERKEKQAMTHKLEKITMPPNSYSNQSMIIIIIIIFLKNQLAVH